jgi:hypothetical protein
VSRRWGRGMLSKGIVKHYCQYLQLY